MGRKFWFFLFVEFSDNSPILHSPEILNSFAGISVFYGKSFELCKKNCFVEVSMRIYIYFFPWVCHAWIGLKVVLLCGFYCKGGVFLELGVWLLRKHGKMIEKLVNVRAIQLPNFYTISKFIFFFWLDILMSQMDLHLFLLIWFSLWISLLFAFFWVKLCLFKVQVLMGSIWDSGGFYII